MCRSFSIHFQCTPDNPNHKKSYQQSCQKSKISRFIERGSADPEALRGYTFKANRLCQECDPEKRPVPQPPEIEKSGKHVLNVDDGMKEALVLAKWVESL
ncbi:hypothetical protein LTR84_008767 [Exophiala bonariae]|uniref:Uncharacterized protein n=1 Tax=Exophiala bonariae TaxID=1690606 RepID=A0AAV9MZG3_9EURO|nr:hypothetical protein LTR84_008767 [Exophiala bonariae]